MIFEAQFDGDNDELMMETQLTSYGESLAHIFNSCRRRFIQANDLLEADSEFVRCLASIESLDHRVLQDIHDVIAAYYRFRFCSSQLSLLDQDRSCEDYLICWTRWVAHETERLSSFNEFARSIAFAVAFANSGIGYLAQRESVRFLVAEYRMIEWARGSRFVIAYFRQEELPA